MGINNPTSAAQQGSFTPTIGGSTTFGSQTYSIQVGRYVQVGNLISIWGRVLITAKDPSIAGAVILDGLPFTASATSNLNYPLSLVVSRFSLDSGYTQFIAAVIVGTNIIQLIENGPGAASIGIPVANMGAPSDLTFGGTYLID